MSGARIIVMGVSGSGKSTVGAALAAALGAAFTDADALHPNANVEKMRRGEPLTDADRWPWLDAVGRALAAGPASVVACSALKRAYRERIAAACGDRVTFAHLDGQRELIAARMAARAGHFMPLSLLDDQFAKLEPPGADEPALTVSAAAPTREIVAEILRALGRRGT